MRYKRNSSIIIIMNINYIIILRNISNITTSFSAIVCSMVSKVPDRMFKLMHKCELQEENKENYIINYEKLR